jgi:hypothetical protein
MFEQRRKTRTSDLRKEATVESWRKVWRVAAKLLTVDQLLALDKGIALDDKRLIQGATSSPPPQSCKQDWPVEAACLLGYPFVAAGDGFADSGENLSAATVAATEEFFARSCFEIDQKLGEPAGCRWLLNFWDETPREEARLQLLPEVRLAIEHRRDSEAKDKPYIVERSHS